MAERQKEELCFPKTLKNPLRTLYMELGSILFPRLKYQENLKKLKKNKVLDTKVEIMLELTKLLLKWSLYFPRTKSDNFLPPNVTI